MPYNLLQSMIKQLKERGVAPTEAEKIATKHLQRAGKLQAGTMRLTDLGKQESQLDWNSRKLAREARKRGVPEFWLQVINGKVRMKPEYRKRSFRP